MIESLSVKGLNNRIDADWEFNEDLNIITGKNGSGKTTVLKLLWYLISGNLERVIFEIPFQQISVKGDSLLLGIHRRSASEFTLISTDFFSNTQKTGTVEQLEDTLKSLNKHIVTKSKKSLFFPTFRRIEGGFSGLSDVDHPDRSATSTTEMFQSSLERFSSDISTNGHRFIASISTHDVGTLLTQKYADINEEIRDRQSQLLDEISQKFQVSPGDSIGSEVSQAVPSVLTDIQQVAKESERLFKPFLVLSELARTILEYQAIQVVGQNAHGEITKGITLGEGSDGATLETTKGAIASDKLSAGEKQMLSFLCYNAFSENTVIFIDEPELSLHVDWQRLLLPTLLEQETGNQFFIATHSPFIYAKYPDKEIPLGDKGDANECRYRPPRLEGSISLNSEASSFFN